MAFIQCALGGLTALCNYSFIIYFIGEVDGLFERFPDRYKGTFAGEVWQLRRFKAASTRASSTMALRVMSMSWLGSNYLNKQA